MSLLDNQVRQAQSEITGVPQPHVFDDKIPKPTRTSRMVVLGMAIVFVAFGIYVFAIR